MPDLEQLAFKFRYDKPHIVAIDDGTLYDTEVCTLRNGRTKGAVTKGH